MTDPLISIIVPAYNVEKYIQKCITSILEQTYSNIEVIVINDGSTDKTPELLASFDDKRLKLINQTNSGVSASRNRGIEIAQGDYLVFVDGDDYLCGDYVDYFVKLALKYDSDFVFSTKCITTKNWKEKKVFDFQISNEKATALLLNPDVIVGCWNKIYKTSFLKDNNIFFSTDLFYGEGLRLITTASQLAKNIVVTNAKKYFYRRNNAFSATTKFNINKYYNGEKSLFLIRDTLILKSSVVLKQWLLHLCFFYLGGVTALAEMHLIHEYKTEYKRWISFIRRRLFTILFSRSVSLYRKGVITAGALFPRLVSKANIKRKKKIAISSIE